MARTLLLAFLTAVLACAPASAGEKKKSAAKKKVELGASCKAPAVGRCAACSIVCQVGETATCAGGLAVADACHAQPACKCSK